MITEHLPMKIVNDATEAPDYNKTDEFKGATISQAIIVPGGMESGKSTVDLQLTAADGSKVVTMISQTLLEGLVAAAQGAQVRNAEKKRH